MASSGATANRLGESDSPPTSRPWIWWLNASCDPEWPLFMVFFLTPALGFWLLGSPNRASFFAGTAVYLGVLKWVGWLVFSRRSQRPLAYLVFPAEILIGLAVLCSWFYVRNLLGWLWPESYGLHELSGLAYFVVAIHLVHSGIRAVAWFRSDSLPAQTPGRGLAGRVAFYGPFCFMLIFATWFVSGTIDVQTTDSINHAFFARVYLNDGIFFRPIIYTSGFGAINAVTAAVSPLSVVQAVNLQHVLWLITALFLITGTLGCLAQDRLLLIHSLVPPFLSLFPVYSLYPDDFYEHPAMQTAPAILAALCLIPLLTAVPSCRRFYLLLGVQGMLSALAVALNPAAAAFVVVAASLGLGIYCFKGRSVYQLSPVKVIGAQLILGAATGLLVFCCDQFYNRLVFHPKELGAQAPTSSGSSGKPLFSFEKATRAVVSTNPVSLSPNASNLPGDPKSPYWKWPSQAPQRFFPWLALGLGLGALGIFATLGRRRAVGPGPPALAAATAGGMALWVILKYAITFIMEGLSRSSWSMHHLSIYLGFLLVRCELLVLFFCLLAAAVLLYLVVRGFLQDTEVLPQSLAAILAALACWALFAVPFLNRHSSGHIIIPAIPIGGSITPDDVKLVAWIDARQPPLRGLIGLPAYMYINRVAEDRIDSSLPPGIEVGSPGAKAKDKNVTIERHIYPVGGGRALLFYSKHYNFCFTHIDFSLPNSFESYLRNVEESFNADWLLRNNVRYFYIVQRNLRKDSELARAITCGQLVPVHCVGGSCIYKVVGSPRQ
jgi:hypothetical protein